MGTGGVEPQPENDLRADWVKSAADRFAPMLLQYASSLLGRLDHAHDVVQDTMAKLCGQDPAELDGRLAEWLFTVCRNRAIDVRRKERRMIPITQVGADRQGMLDGVTELYRHPSGGSQIPIDSPVASHDAVHAADPAVVVEQRETEVRAILLMAGLPDNQREVLRLKFQAGLSYKEIAAVTELSVSNVGFLIHAGLKTLRERMK